MNEAFSSGAEIIRLARMVQSVDINGATPEEITVFLEDRIQPFFKDYEPSLDQKVLAAMNEDRERTCIFGVLAGYLYER